MQNTLHSTTFIFFSRQESFNFSLCVRQILDTADESLFNYLPLIRNCLNLIESSEHKISLDLCIALNALLGVVFVSSRDGQSSRAAYEQAVMLLAKKISAV